MKPKRPTPQPIVEATLPQPRAFFCTITADEFRNNEALRQRLSEAIDEILLVAFMAADSAEEAYASISAPTDLARDALKNAERVGIARYKQTLLTLAKKPLIPTPPNDDYQGMTPFDALGK